MAHIPDERFKGTLYDVEDCLDAITDEEVVKESEKKKAVKMFGLFLNFCIEENIIDSYNLRPLESKLGLNGIQVETDVNGTRATVHITNIVTNSPKKRKEGNQNEVT